VTQPPITLGDEAEVELDVFSGRPNPKWTLSGQRVRDLEERLEGLEPVQADEPHGLGYRGFVIRSTSGVQVRAFNSILILTDARGKSSFRDQARLEQRLLEQADEHGFADLIARFREGGNPSKA
jgi:hypothetical protein